MVVFKKAILDRAQEHPHNGHRAAQQQILPDIFVQNPVGYRKAPRHGHADVDQVGQHETGGRRQRGDVLIELPKDTGEDEQAQRETKFRRGFSFDAVPFSTPCLYRNYFTIQAGEKPVLKAKLVLLFIGALCPLLLQIRKESAKVIGKEKSEIAISDNLAQFGGAYRIRTGDLYNANVARYQLC